MRLWAGPSYPVHPGQAHASDFGALVVRAFIVPPVSTGPDRVSDA